MDTSAWLSWILDLIRFCLYTKLNDGLFHHCCNCYLICNFIYIHFLLLKGISEDMDVVVLKILKNLKLYPICRLAKLTCHSFIYAGKRPDVLKSETKNSLLFRVIPIVRILTIVTGSWIPVIPQHTEMKEKWWLHMKYILLLGIHLKHRETFIMASEPIWSCYRQTF